MRGVESEPISAQPPSNIVALLREREAGQPEALSRLTEAAYPALLHIAHRYYERERRTYTLQTKPGCPQDAGAASLNRPVGGSRCLNSGPGCLPLAGSVRRAVSRGASGRATDFWS